MNFKLTEDEYKRLHSVQRQLNMMARLCGEMKGFEVPCAPEDLSEFFTAQEAAMDAVRKAVDHRYDLARAGDCGMEWHNWVHALNIAGVGENAAPRGAKDKIDDALSHMATLDPDYEQVVKTWVEITGIRAIEQGWRTPAAAPQDTPSEPQGHLSLELFADLMRAVSGQAMEPDELNETVNQFLAAFDEHHPERAVIVQALNAALMHNGYEWVLTCNQGGQHAQWVRKPAATAPDLDTTTAPTVGKQRKRERVAKKAKASTTAHMGATA